MRDRHFHRTPRSRVGGAVTDTTPPVISNIQETGLSSSGVTISWDVDEPANGFVEYGTSTAYGSETTHEESHVLAHSRGISGLSAGTTYYYNIVSSDDAGNTAQTAGDFTTTGAVVATDFVGIPIAAENKGNVHMPAGAVACRFKCTTASTPVEMRIPVTNRDGYGLGDGGSYDFYVTDDDGSGFPSSNLVTGRGTWTPGSRQSGSFYVAQSIPGGSDLTVGATYYAVVENVHGAGDTNQTHWNCTYTNDPGPVGSAQRKWPNDENFMVYANTKYGAPGSWTTEGPTWGTPLPNFDLVYSSGAHEGFAGSRGTGGKSGLNVLPNPTARWAHEATDTDDMYRMRFVAPRSESIQTLYARISRSPGSGTGDMTIALRTAPSGSSRGALVAEAFSSTSGIQERAIGNDSESDMGDWLSVTLASSEALTAGTEYALEVRAAAGTTIWTPGILLRSGGSPDTWLESFPFDESTYHYEMTTNGGGTWQQTRTDADGNPQGSSDTHCPQMYADVV